MVTERRPHAHASANEDDGKVGSKKSVNKETHAKLKKQKVSTTNDSKGETKETTNNDDGQLHGKSASDVGVEFEEICNATREHLSIDEMRRILEANGQDASGPDDAVVPQWHVPSS